MKMAQAKMMSRGGLALALGAMHTLRPIWRAQNISNQTKIALYKSLVLSIVLYAAETWTLKKRDQRRLLSFEMSCLRRILGISRRDKIRNDCIRKQLGLETSIMDRIQRGNLPFTDISSEWTSADSH